MSDRRIFRCFSLLMLAAVLTTGAACDWLANLAPGAAADALGYGVILRIVNQSGVPVEVEIDYQLGETRTRETSRLLAAEGIETEQVVVWTRAEVIIATARVSAGPPSPEARIQIGDVIARQEWHYNVDYQAGDTIEFVIPDLGPGPDPLADCNGNSVFDTLDLTAGTSLDCNGNEIPDECDIAEGTSADYDGDGVPDECERQACCFTDDSCLEKIVELCVASGGKPLGAGTTCATTQCTTQPMEACCLIDGSCRDVTTAACSAEGGMAKGTGTACATTTCPPIDLCQPPYGDPCLPECPSYCDAVACDTPDCNGNGIADRCEVLARLYVNAAATGTDDGTSWTNAFVSLDAALQTAWCADGTVQGIWVAAGVYKPGIPLDTTDPRSATFAPPPVVSIYGHFAGSENSLADRALSDFAGETVLSGDIGTAEDASDNCYHVFMPPGGLFLGWIDGFTIAYGNADGTAIAAPASGFGGGMYFLDSGPIISNCLFRGNNAAVGGGGLCIDGTHPIGVPARLANCRFISNYASAESGSTLGGGGMIITNQFGLMPAQAGLVNCVFAGNFTSGYGGGLLAHQTAYGVFVGNSSFSLNQTAMYFGAGAALYCDAAIVNSVLWGNGMDASESRQLGIDPIKVIGVVYSCIQGWTGEMVPGGGTGNIGGNLEIDDPLFVDPETGNLRLGAGSRCINAGLNAAVLPDIADLNHNGVFLEPTPVDVDGLPRFMPTSAPAVDMGAYEDQGL